jgi:drug/metabolite transporter (DMT)-like permease
MKKGIYLSLLTAVISGFSVFANSMFVSKTDPLIFALIRNTLVALMITMILWYTNKLVHLKELTKKQWLQLIGIGAIGGGIPFALFFSGLAMIGATNGNILHKTLFLWVALLAFPILKERLGKLQILGYSLIFLATFFIGGSFKFVPQMGSYLVLGATIMWAIENILAKITLKTVHPIVVSWGRMTFGLPFLFVAAIVMGKSGLLLSPHSYAMMPLIVSSIFLVGYVTSWYTALKHAPATLVSSVVVIAPIITAVVSSAIVFKPIAMPQVISFTVLAFGVWLIIRRQHISSC